MKTPNNFLLLPCCLLLAAIGAYTENIALNAPYTFNYSPDFNYCTDADDVTQLTDGQYVEGYFWTQPGTVGWRGKGYVIITVDLGADKPISGVSFSTAAGVAGVEWPTSIGIYTAEENGLFHEIGELTALSAQKELPPEGKYAVHRYSTDALHTHGRKIAFVVVGGNYIFCDEVEVWKGEDQWVNEPLPGEGVADLGEYVPRLLTCNGIKHRINADINGVRKAAESLSDDEQKSINEELDAITKELEMLPVDYGKDFKAVLPVNDTHAKVFAVLAGIWKKNGLDKPAMWAVDPWKYMELCPGEPVPEDADGTGLQMHIMQNETRPVAFNLAAAEAVETKITISGLPDNLQAACLDVRCVAWTDTRSGEPVAAALLPLKGDGKTWCVSLVPGLIQQIWVSVNSKGLTPGVYHLKIQANEEVLPFTLQVYPIRFPERPTLHMGGWDYTNVLHHYEVTEANRAPLIAMLQEYFVDTPWAVSSAMPFGVHDESGAMTSPPDTSNFDAWRQLWPDARRYCVFASVRDKFQKWPMDTPEFHKAVGDWATFWAQYMRDAGLDPAQLFVLLVDEPHESDMDKVIISWAKAIRDSGSAITIWEDPTYRDMSKSLPEMIALCDVLCPNRPIFKRADDAYRAFFEEQRAKGKALEFYSCSGPMRRLDPYAYCRLQAWDCWRYGANATSFWAFADGAGGSSWNEYPQPRNAYTPLFIDDETVVPGKHLEAMRVGVQDYEYLVMLQEALEHYKGDKKVRESVETVLRELPGRVCSAAPEEGATLWKTSTAEYTADQARLEILQALMSCK